MPPRGKKNADASSSVLADTGAHIAPTMAEFLEKEEMSQNALIGYARTDILDRKITFGRWNRRQENKDEVKKLVDSFMRNGVYRYLVAHAIPLVVSKDRLAEGGWISPLDENLDFQEPKSIPALRLKDDPAAEYSDEKANLADAPPISAAGGRHRSGALAQYQRMRSSMRTQYKRKVSEWKTALNSDPHNEEFKNCMDRDSRVLKVVSTDVSLKGDWLVALYDEGEWIVEKSLPHVFTIICIDATDKALSNRGAVAYHLATNERKHTYNESAEEGLVQAFTMHSSQHKDWRTIDLVDGATKTTSKHGVEVKQIALLKQDYFWRLCSDIIPETTHYIHSNLFKISKLTTEILSVHGGVSPF